MKKQIFEQFKKSFIEKCKDNSACETEFKKVIASENLKELLIIIKSNFQWCYEEKKIIDISILENIFGGDLCKEIGIIFNTTLEKADNGDYIVLNGGIVQEVLNGGIVQKVLNGGIVRGVWNGGIVQEVLNGGIVQEVLNGGIVQKVLNGGIVQGVWNGGIVQKVLNGGIVRGVWNGGIVREVEGYAVVISKSQKKIWIQKDRFEIIYY